METDAAFRLGQETLQRPLELKGKLLGHDAPSPVREFLILTVWLSIAEGYPTVRSQVFVASLTWRFVSAKRRFRDPHRIQNLTCECMDGNLSAIESQTVNIKNLRTGLDA